MLLANLTLSSFIIFLFVGIFCGIVYDILYVFKWITKNNIFAINIIDFVCCFICGFALIHCIFLYENGSFKVFEVVCLAVGIVFEHIIVKNLFTSPIKWVYNKIKLRKVKKIFVGINNGEIK